MGHCLVWMERVERFYEDTGKSGECKLYDLDFVILDGQVLKCECTQ